MNIKIQRERGSVLLVVVVLLSVMVTFSLANSRRLAALKQEIKLIDQQQQRKYERTSAPRRGAANHGPHAPQARD